jgi:hypothetical protein
MRLDDLSKLKNPITSLGIEPVTFWLVAQRLKATVATHTPIDTKTEGKYISQMHIVQFQVINIKNYL